MNEITNHINNAVVALAHGDKALVHQCIAEVLRCIVERGAEVQSPEECRALLAKLEEVRMLYEQA